MNRRSQSLAKISQSFFATATLSILAAACSPAAEQEAGVQTREKSLEVVATGDSLAAAYEVFKTHFEADGMHSVFRAGMTPIPLLNTESVELEAQVQLAYASSVGNIHAEATGLTSTDAISLWMFKNVAGEGRDASPETGDEFLLLGDFTFNTDKHVLDVNVGEQLKFDFDALVIARQGQSPADSVLAVGYRSLFEKRYFREKFGIAAPVVAGLSGTNASSLDPLIQVGADVFFNETFEGNGRTCGTCHRAENNMTIDPAFIASLPQSDPLFIAENVPELASLENHDLLRGKALIKENLDGFDDLDNKFVMRSVQHTFGLADSVARDQSIQPGFPPDEMTGWGGDGAPGRGTLLEFLFGAIQQHFPQSLDRTPGVDFRVPTQLELDAVEAFQLFSGRQNQPDVTPIMFADPTVQEGKDLFNSQGLCFACHNDAGSNIGNFDNVSLNTGVANRPGAAQLGLPDDAGLGRDAFSGGGFGDGSFNIQPLIEAADTAPFFHNNTAVTLEEAIAHYMSPAFKNSQVVLDNPAFGDLSLDDQQIPKVAAFLRALNVAENIRQVRERVSFVRDTRGSGNDEILRIAIADTEDAIDVLDEQGLYPAARSDLMTIRQTLQIALANADSDRPAFMANALVWLDIAKGRLFTSNPNNEF